jgi:TM2 domain-containing membrane protein YozV
VAQYKPIPVPYPQRSPAQVAVASLLVPGLGQFLLGQRGKGTLFMVLWAASCGYAWLIAPALAWDAHVLARRQEAGEELDPWGFF